MGSDVGRDLDLKLFYIAQYFIPAGFSMIVTVQEGCCCARVEVRVLWMVCHFKTMH